MLTHRRRFADVWQRVLPWGVRDMRIIAGQAGGLSLRVPRGEVRPTTDRVREALFSILRARVAGGSVLDLFCGSGALALEALSRGASRARMVDSSCAACRVAEENLRASGLSGGSVSVCDCLRFVKRDRGVYDLILADPPYCKALGDRDFISELLMSRLHEMLAPGGVFVAEAQAGYGAAEHMGTPPLPWRLSARRQYGKNVLLFYTVPS